MNKDVENLKVVKILDAMYCVRCRFAHVADVLMTDGTRKKMFYCSRRDCDNWQTEETTSPPVKLDDSIFGTEEPIAEGWDTE
ncbi:MAG: hypothetical protein IT209_04805 [Armatimonadetes bacterium]|nr:hypothetical protein [Armatimonadota bacterium]